MDEINTLSDLIREASNQRTGGYEVDVYIYPNLDKARCGDGFFLVIDVTSTEPNPEVNINGEWWFDGGNKVMQVL